MINLHAKAKQDRAKKRASIVGLGIDVNCSFEHPSFLKTDEELAFIDHALGDNFIFSSLNADERHQLMDAMENEMAPAGTEIIKQGDSGDFFYIVQKGDVDFIADGASVGACGAGDSFGELALLYKAPRAATCLARTDCSLWKVDQYTFRHLLARQAHAQEQSLRGVLKKIELFSHLRTARLYQFADALTPVRFEEGERIVTKGDEGLVFYVIQEGIVKLHDIGLGESQFIDQILGAGDWFGERALLTGDTRAANVTAVSDCTLLAISRENFESSFGCLQENMDRGIRQHTLRSLPIFANSKFDDHEISELTDLMTEQCFKTEEYLCKIGEPYKQHLWIIRSGRVLVVDGKTGKLFNLAAGDYFGDKSIKAEPGHISSHDALFEENSTCWVLTRDDIESVIGNMKRLGESIPFQRSMVNRSLEFNDLEKHRMLGMGAFGKVWLTSHMQGDKKVPFALKQLEKRELLKSKQIQGVTREKEIMYSIEHPFLIQLVSSFQDENLLYLLLELIPGGELFNVVHTDEKDGIPNDQACFYSACVSEALGHLHQRNICYRDLKPENILIDANGYCIVVDFGFAKVVVDKTYTLCGTPEYLAPEVIMSKGHDTACDYWSFGVLVYELLVGRSPFFIHGTDQMSLFKRIVMAKYTIPDIVNDDAKDVIEKLLVRRQAARLGNMRNGHKDVREHPWFKPINFKKLLKKELEAPWVPIIVDPFDSSHFDDYSREEQECPDYQTKLTEEEQAMFKNF